jgi:hypothetical protein
LAEPTPAVGVDQKGTVTIPNGAMAFPLWRENW